MSSNVDSMASQARVANAASRRSCSAALADPDLVDVAIEPGSVTDGLMLPADRFAWRLASCECDASRVLGFHSCGARRHRSASRKLICPD